MLRLNDDPVTWVTDVIRGFCDGPENVLGDGSGERAWADPLVGFSRGDDPLYEQYKEYVGPFHWTPHEIFARTFPSLPVEPHDLTVICWILPQTRSTKVDNRQQTTFPAERWARSRIFGEDFNRKLRQHLVVSLQTEGVAALSPMLSPHWESRRSDRYLYASTWSERHAAYACGLGTFGLCDGLITPVGKAVRIGTVIACLSIPPTPRPYDDPHAYCLFYSRGICGVCMDRCPVGAITVQGHDKAPCSQHLHPATSDFVRAHYGFDGYGCGLCQTGVPCESKIPTARDV